MERNSRNTVLRILMETERDPVRFSAELRRALDERAELPENQRAFLKRLAEGCLGDRLRLDAVIDRFSRQPAARLRPAIRWILRMGIYQILYMDAVPDAAACNEQVKLARRYGFGNLAGFVNAVLRRVAAEKESLRAELSSGRTDIRYSIPDWILALWREQQGGQRAEEIAEMMNRIRPVTIRLREFLSPARRERLLAELAAAGAEPVPSRWLPYAFSLRGTADIRRLPGFAEGAFTVQDESSQLCAEAAGIRGGETVYDVCAAPGGKAMHCADKLLACAAAGKDGGGLSGAGGLPAGALHAGRVFAFDQYPGKLRRIEENLERMGLSSLVTAGIRDARAKIPESERKTADLVICDAPCSGLGVMGRKQGIRYRVTREDLDVLAHLQREILRRAAGYGKPGGVLIYSTCTINRMENEENAEFIERELGLLPDPLKGLLPEGLPGIRGNTVQLMPDIHGTDGFFIARFRFPER
ncbi:16S rRNA (cytosine(967)-C(5))-methyltransferase RsmB [Lachnoclostridium sp. Marseille-P6806]|uniref:16S rRNA (cytosine(967)-C(5))-methyltransferase RsmB n=1 Tax=Lachnoclostridium sp. Marseille-P6806 TaxID=2364793 RepID=UPI0010312309|nr:16S rRNA (cytosine(967)-C(5))-methyltransferase RsmB [Lachnoclostridium sp. Marseille-P6806]